MDYLYGSSQTLVNVEFYDVSHVIFKESAMLVQQQCAMSTDRSFLCIYVNAKTHGLFFKCKAFFSHYSNIS